MVLCLQQTWYSPVHAPLRTNPDEFRPFKIGRRQRSKSPMTSPRIIRFRAEFQWDVISVHGWDITNTDLWKQTVGILELYKSNNALRIELSGRTYFSGWRPQNRKSTSGFGFNDGTH